MNHQNDQLRYAYQVYLKGIGGRDEKTIDAALRHIVEYETFTKFQNFQTITEQGVMDFREYLQQRPSKTKDGGLSASSIVHTLADLRAFFHWLAQKPAFRRMNQTAISSPCQPIR